MARFLVVLSVAVQSSAESIDTKQEESNTSWPVHQEVGIEGWLVHVDSQLLEGANKPLGETALKVLSHQLYFIKLILPENRVQKLQSVPIWLDLHHPLWNLQYHLSADWLKQHGHDPSMAQSVHIPNAQLLVDLISEQDQPAVILHELAHAYHDRVLGFDYSPIRQLYNEAVAAGYYVSVLDGSGHLKKHYALTNDKEFFAELTESFLWTNNFYPFVRAELREYDPATAKLMERIWLEPENTGSNMPL